MAWRVRRRRSGPGGLRLRLCPKLDPTECVDEMVSESRIPHRIANLLISISDSKQKVDDFVGDLTF